MRSNSEHDVRVEHGKQRLEVPTTRRGEERVDDLPLTGEIWIKRRRTPAHPAARAARELTRRCRRTADDRGDIVKRDGEGVVQHKGESLGGRQCLEDDKQGEPYGIGEHGLLFRRRGRGVGQLEADGLLAAKSSRAQEVQADPRDDRRHPSVDVLDVVRTRSAHTEPGVLDGIVGLGKRAEHAVRNGA